MRRRLGLKIAAIYGVKDPGPAQLSSASRSFVNFHRCQFQELRAREKRPSGKKEREREVDVAPRSSYCGIDSQIPPQEWKEKLCLVSLSFSLPLFLSFFLSFFASSLPSRPIPFLWQQQKMASYNRTETSKTLKVHSNSFFDNDRGIESSPESDF